MKVTLGAKNNREEYIRKYGTHISPIHATMHTQPVCVFLQDLCRGEETVFAFFETYTIHGRF